MSGFFTASWQFTLQIYRTADKQINYCLIKGNISKMLYKLLILRYNRVSGQGRWPSCLKLPDMDLDLHKGIGVCLY